MKRIVVELFGMPFNPTYEIDDDSIKVGDKVRVPGSGGMIDDNDIGTVIAIGSDYDGPCKRAEKIVIDESLAALLQKAVDKRIIRNDQRDQIIALASRDLEDATRRRRCASARHMLGSVPTSLRRSGRHTDADSQRETLSASEPS